MNLRSFFFFYYYVFQDAETKLINGMQGDLGSNEQRGNHCCFSSANWVGLQQAQTLNL